MDKRIFIGALVAIIGVGAAVVFVVLPEVEKTYEQGIFDGCNYSQAIQTGQFDTAKCRELIEQIFTRDDLSLPEY